jgi:hypothetical protein
MLYRFTNLNVILTLVSDSLAGFAVLKENDEPSVPKVLTNKEASLESTRDEIIAKYGTPVSTSSGTLTYLGQVYLVFEPAGEGVPGASILALDVTKVESMAKRISGTESPIYRQRVLINSLMGATCR